MTEKLNNQIRIPVWASGIIVTLMLALMSFTITQTSGSQRALDGMNHNRELIDSHESSHNEDMQMIRRELEKKASDEKVELIYEAVLRLEGKIDKKL